MGSLPVRLQVALWLSPGLNGWIHGPSGLDLSVYKGGAELFVSGSPHREAVDRMLCSQVHEGLTGFTGPELGGRSDLLGGEEQGRQAVPGHMDGPSPVKIFHSESLRMTRQFASPLRKPASRSLVLRSAVAPYCLIETTAPERPAATGRVQALGSTEVGVIPDLARPVGSPWHRICFQLCLFEGSSALPVHPSVQRPVIQSSPSQGDPLEPGGLDAAVVESQLGC